MTSILAPSSEARILYNAYSSAGLLNDPITFVIPVFENMPEIKVESPNINPEQFISDNTRVNPNREGLVIRTGAGSGYEILTTVGRENTLTRISMGIGQGVLWDRVILENGVTGYTLQNNLDIIETEGISFNRSLNVTGNIITGIDVLDASVQNLRRQITTEHHVTMYNHRDHRLEDNQNIGTGSRVVFRNDEGYVLAEYYIVIYGDVNGDGRINSVDLLVLQRHILRLETLEPLFLMAANTMRDGRAPTSVDLLRIQRHILRLHTLEQRAIGLSADETYEVQRMSALLESPGRTIYVPVVIVGAVILLVTGLYYYKTLKRGKHS